jgi:hypothetical protein
VGCGSVMWKVGILDGVVVVCLLVERLVVGGGGVDVVVVKVKSNQAVTMYDDSFLICCRLFP